MYIPKRYGESKKQSCPFCGKQSVTENKQGVPVCTKHKNDYLDLKCLCGEFLDIRSGKWGPYGVCMRCGNVSWSKILAANPDITPAPQVKPESEKSAPQKKKQVQAPRQYKAVKETKKEIVITSDELDFM